MRKNEKYEHPDIEQINLCFESVLCASFTVGNGEDGDLPGYDEETFEW